MSVGTFGVGVGAVGRFNRVLPPRTRESYDAAYELRLEVMRWFHYRHRFEVFVKVPVDHRNVDEVMMKVYKDLLRSKMKYWEFLEEAVRSHIREFKDTFKDVLAEMEFTR